ncbi:MAG: acyl-ACP--UDP-N-acetylglucosamine O-acyltransferase [Pseudomonadota bacterium]
MIHPTAIVDPSAELGSNCSVGPYAIIGPNVQLGDNSDVRPHAIINGPTAAGTNNTFFQFCSIGEAPQDLKYNGEPTVLTIGDNNVFREYTTLHRGTESGGGTTQVGSDNLLMAYTHVAHDCRVGNRIIMSNAASIAGHVEIEDDSILGGFTSVHQFTRIGAHSFCGLGTVVNRDVPPFVTVAGNHARAVSINKKGLQRRGFSSECISALHRAFRLLIKSRRSREGALAELAPLAATFPEVTRFIEFVTQSERGVVR